MMSSYFSKLLLKMSLHKKSSSRIFLGVALRREETKLKRSVTAHMFVLN